MHAKNDEYQFLAGVRWKYLQGSYLWTFGWFGWTVDSNSEQQPSFPSAPVDR